MSFDLGSVVAHIKADISGFQDGLNKAHSEVGSFTSKVSAGFGALTRIAGVAGLALAGAGIAGAKVGLDSAAKYEQSTIAFTTLLKDRTKALETLKVIEEDAKKTPFDLAPLIDMNQRLIGAGMSAEGARKTVLGLGDAVSSTGAGSAEMIRIGNTIGQVYGKGKADAVDFKEMVNAGWVTVKKDTAEAMGVTMAQFEDLVSAGEVDFNTLQGALTAVTGEGGKYFGAMDEQSKSLTGRMATLGDTVRIALKNVLVDSGAFDMIKNGVEKLTIFIENDAVPAIQNIIKSIKEFVNSESVQNTIKSVIEFVQNTIKSIKEFVNSEFVQNTIMHLADVFSSLAGKMQGSSGTINTVVTEIVNFFQNYLMPAVKSVVSFVSERWEWFSLMFKGVWEIIMGVVQFAWAIVYGILKVGLALLAGDWGKAWIAVKEMLVNAWEGIKKIFGGAIDFIKGWGGLVIHNLTKPFEEAWEKIKEKVNKIKDSLDFTKRHSPSVVDIVQHGVQEVNRALSGLIMMPNIGAPQMAASVVGNQGFNSGPSMISLNIDMQGALISDEAGASIIGEKIGDGIIRKLQQNVKF